jgi:hypothetical protein
MKTISITKTRNYVDTWRIENTKEKIEYESDSNTFFVWDADAVLTASFEQSQAAAILKLVDALVSSDIHDAWIGKTDFIPNTSFLSMVLTQFLHKLNTIHNDDDHN